MGDFMKLLDADKKIQSDIFILIFIQPTGYYFTIILFPILFSADVASLFFLVYNLL